MDSTKSLSESEEVLLQFGISPSSAAIDPIHNGLINHTWKIGTGGRNYILQKINHTVFKNPQDVAGNIAAVADYLAQYHPGYIFTPALKTNRGETLYKSRLENYYRLFSFIEGSHTSSSVATSGQAFEAARQFGKFTCVLKEFDAASLKTTIPFFHDLEFRYQQFLDALKHGNEKRIKTASTLIGQVKQHVGMVDHFKKIKTDPGFKLRVMHHDTKISNVLFDKNNKGICVIDLDTLMPGYFISDVGDMMRTYLSPVTEEERDTSKIQVRPEIYTAIVKGYLQEMEQELTGIEKDHFFYAGTFMIYMQVLRFLTDHLNNDSYYGAAYEGHNEVRAINQLVLLQQFIQMKNVLEKGVAGMARL